MKEPEGGWWLNTATGRRFPFLAPRPEDIDILDIAIALSHQARYAGHTRGHYCVTPDTRLLTTDLRWVPAGDLLVGAMLIGFDEEPERTGVRRTSRRRIRPSVVTANEPDRRSLVRMFMSDGTELTCSVEHPWLVATKASRNQSWKTAGALMGDLRNGSRRYMHRFAAPWGEDQSRDGGYLAGIFDGEGHVSFRGRCLETGFAQKPGLVLDLTRRLMEARGFRVDYNHRPYSSVTTGVVRGGWQEQARLLGTLRPVRLLDKFKRTFEKGRLSREFAAHSLVEILEIEPIGLGEVAAISTSTKTYFAEGFAAHNSVAAHSVVIARVVRSLGGSPDEQRWGLLHDAAEAYVTDVPWPLKAAGLVPELQAAEAKVMAAVRERFGLSETEPQIVRDIDLEMLEVESEALLVRHPAWEIARPARPEVRRQFRFRPGPDLVDVQFLSEAIECGLVDKAETWGRWNERAEAIAGSPA